MATIAELIVHVGVKDDVAKGLASASKKMADVGKTMTRKVTLPILAAGAGLFALAGQGEEAQAKLKSSFDSMGASAFTSIDKLNAHAEALQNATTFDDEAINEMQSVLLTFGNVTGDTFGTASEAILDMSAKLGTDLQSSAIQVGKALNDPVKGISALSRVGVSFTQDQKDMVKQLAETGDMAGAQAIILGELEKQFGGTAEAMAQTGTGQAKQAMNALGDAGESIGQFLVPVVSKLAGWVKTLAEGFQKLSPETQKWILRIAGVVAAVGPLLLITGKFAGAISEGGSLFKGFAAAKKGFLAMKALFMANPWILLIAAVVALVIIIVKNWDKILAFLKKVWEKIKKAAGKVWEFVTRAFKKGVEFIKNLFLNFTPLGILIKHFDKIKEAATAVKDWLIARFKDAVAFLKGLFMNWTLPGLIMKHWDKIKDGVTAVKDFITTKFNALLDFFRLLPSRIGRAVTGMWDGIKDAFRSVVNWIIEKWNNFSIGFGPVSLPTWLGGGTFEFRVDTPNIPYLHDGGIFNAPPGRREGLAMLEDGERVTPAGGSDKGGVVIHIHGDVYDHDRFVRKVREAGVDIRQLGLQS